MGGIVVGSFRSSEFQGLDSPCIVIDYMIHHHIDIIGKERRELKWFESPSYRDHMKENRSVEFFEIYWASIRIMQWIIRYKTCMDGYVIPIRRECDQCYALMWPNIMAAILQTACEIGSRDPLICWQTTSLVTGWACC